MGWADLALYIFDNSDEIYTVTSPSFDEVPKLTETQAKLWMEWINMNLDSLLLEGISLENFQEDWYKKDGKLELRITYQTNKKPANKER